VERDGVLALESAPTHCDQLMLFVPAPRQPGEGDPSPEFWPLKRSECRRYEAPESQCHLLTEDDDARGLIAHFAHFNPEMEILPEPEHCEPIREHCVADEHAGWYPDGGYGSAGSSESWVHRVACSKAEAAVQACLDADARRIEETKRESLCRGLALVTRGAGARRAVALQAVGPDGAEWGREIVRPGRAMPDVALLLTPLAVVADVPIMAVEATAVSLYWVNLFLISSVGGGW